MISRDAFAQEVRSLTDTAFAVSYLILGHSADCEDAMSAAILRAYENRGKLKKRESFRAWFLQILRHEAYNLLRKQRRLTPVEELPEADQRTALLLQQEGYDLAEIGQALDVPVGTVKSRISRAKKTLRAILEE